MTMYQVGGSLDSQNPTYVVRKADADLYQELKNGNFCYVLNSRQMGKSSLRVQTMKKLQAEGFACGSIDLTVIGSESVTPDTWYGGIAFELLKSFSLFGKVNFTAWWREHNFLPPGQRFNQFIEGVLLAELEQNIVIFIDEIDGILKITFKDDLFTFIRACYNQRVDKPEYNRLTFCLLGVATPSDLIADKRRTPFNIGRAIELTGFTLKEATPALTPGLAAKTDHPERVLKQILDWTGGQPFLTQKLCQLILDKATSRKPNLAKLVKTHIIANWEGQDEPEHLRTIRDRILSNEQRTSRLLGLYQQILDASGIPPNPPLKRGGNHIPQPPFLKGGKTKVGKIAADGSREQTELRLSGLVVQQNGYLQVYNPIYEAIFDPQWVEQELAKLRPYNEAIKAWLESNRQDSSRLLRGQALEEALHWAADKNLNSDDYAFFSASQELERRELQSDLAAEREANQILEQAKQEAERLIWEAKEATKIERAGVRALREFESQGGQIQALLMAMEAGQALQKLVKDKSSLAEYPATSPLLALQVILDNIRERNQFTGHQSWVWSVCFSPDGHSIATASHDGTARLWDLSGKQIAQFSGHQGSVRSVCFSPDGQTIATASKDGTARLWDLSGNQIAEFSGHQGSLRSVCFSPDGKTLATASKDGKARLWDLSGKLIALFAGHQSSVRSVCFSPNGKAIATASSDRTARLWDLSGNQIVEFTGHQDWVLSVCFSPDGKTIATASSDRTARLWDLDGNQIAQFTGHQNLINSICFSPDGQTFATASGDRTARLWDLDGNQIAQFTGHQDWVWSICFSPDGKTIATTSYDRKVRLWDLWGNQIACFSGHQDWVSSVCFSPNCLSIVTASGDGTALLWDLSKKQIAQFSGHQNWVRSVCFSPDGRIITTASHDRTARLWDLSGNQIVEFSGHQDPVRSVCFSPDGQTIATASDDRTARLWDLSGNQIAQFNGHQDEVLSVSFSADGQTIATAARDGTARLWDLSGNQIAKFSRYQEWVWRVCFSPDGKTLAIASSDGTARLWDILGNQIAEFRGHQGQVWSVCFSPNGQTLATASSDGTARLWDLSGNQIAEFRGHQGEVWSVCFSPDGQTLATASADRTARLWDLSGKLLASRIPGYPTVPLWRARTLDELLAMGWAWLGDYLASHPEARERLRVRG
ncbi:AAA-like domain-containing protein [[Phormidium] sp. ETS-05]|uniref:WD40 domain-containing protein n=1 Tax=[Phormidium] sp. ETS-05 TaxID=222819 RepID=UPI001E3897A5|nr:AAA-like domain-containing protein [[Phormidium] sp. ETS-05]